MIESYRDKETAEIAAGYKTERLPPELQRRARLLMARIHAAVSLNDLKVLQSHGLRALNGDRAGQYSIDIGGQWQICFVWRQGNAYDVELVG